MMDDNENRSFNSLVEQFLGSRLPKRLVESIVFPELHHEARCFILRMFALMQQAGYPVTEFTPLLIRMLSEMVPNTLPSAWEGRIPPVTMPGRHQKFDAYIANQAWSSLPENPVFIDIGCGFPPHTTIDTARQFPDWQVIGVDRNFPPYIVYDHEGNYACFDRDGLFQYFQPGVGNDGLALYAHPDKTRIQFTNLFNDLSQGLQPGNDQMSSVFKMNDNKIIQDHIRDIETDNLVFKNSDIREVQLPSARVIRCMNVLLYAKPDSRKDILKRLSEFLADDAILIAGTNGNNIHARYIVYRKKNDVITPEEFSFSPDNLRPFGIMPWFTIHDNDPEATCLATLTGVIRNNKLFWQNFSHRFDDLLADYGICHRAKDGFLHPAQTELPVVKIMLKMNQIWQQVIEEGYLKGAVTALRQNGYNAWENPVGDISVQPSGELKYTLQN